MNTSCGVQGCLVGARPSYFIIRMKGTDAAVKGVYSTLDIERSRGHEL